MSRMAGLHGWQWIVCPYVSSSLLNIDSCLAQFLIEGLSELACLDVMDVLTSISHHCRSIDSVPLLERRTYTCGHTLLANSHSVP
jgi:hypothetical protein